MTTTILGLTRIGEEYLPLPQRPAVYTETADVDALRAQLSENFYCSVPHVLFDPLAPGLTPRLFTCSLTIRCSL